MNHRRIVRTGALASAGFAAVLSTAVVGNVAATTEPPTTEPAADASAAPGVSTAPGDASGALAETTYTFADGEYHWAADYGSVPRAAGELEFAAGGVTFVAATKGIVGVTGGDGTVAEVGEGTAVARPEDDTTAIGSIEATFGSFTTLDIAAGAAPDGGPSFTPGAGDRAVTLTSATIEPGASLDLSTFDADFVYVVVWRGVIDASDGTELLPHGSIAWSADAGPLTLSPRSPNVAAELLVLTVAPAAPA